MRITAIEPLAVLSPVEADLLGFLLEDEHPDIDPTTLTVYVVTTPEGGYEKVVAPASERLGIGMTVIASDFTATARRISRDSTKDPTLAVASALVPYDHDV